jgi:hypothetical protein
VHVKHQVVTEETESELWNRKSTLSISRYLSASFFYSKAGDWVPHAGHLTVERHIGRPAPAEDVLKCFLSTITGGYNR